MEEKIKVFQQSNFENRQKVFVTTCLIWREYIELRLLFCFKESESSTGTRIALSERRVRNHVVRIESRCGELGPGEVEKAKTKELSTLDYFQDEFFGFAKDGSILSSEDPGGGRKKARKR